ncbi:MAG: hypothetical protein Q8N51_06915, partial [Gammaproteobacteria bacterium]|nr:hypothetical protein [Gammaproteobacteria bacterium]
MTITSTRRPADRIRAPLLAVLFLATLAIHGAANAMPAYSRQYNISCVVCHSAYPKLNAFGEQFAADNFRMPQWKEVSTVEVGDDLLRLPKFPPFAVRAQ